MGYCEMIAESRREGKNIVSDIALLCCHMHKDFLHTTPLAHHYIIHNDIIHNDIIHNDIMTSYTMTSYTMTSYAMI